jgi:hypothetical protein
MTAILTKDASDETATDDIDPAIAAFDAQVAEVAPLLDLSGWTDTLARAAAPHLLGESVEAVKDTIAALPKPSLAPDLFSVVDRNLPAAVKAQALKFSQATNDTTAKELNEALDQLRQELVEGITTGDTRTLMRNRVMDVFEDLDKNRATMIAHTESSRARHAAQITTVSESGVAQGKQWLIAADACIICQGYAAQGVIPFDQPFGVTDYGPVEHPPGHPNCFCSVTFPLKTPEEIDAAGAANAAKVLRLKEQGRVPAGEPGGGEFSAGEGAGGGVAKRSGKRSSEKAQSPQTKAEIAKQSATYVGKDIQRYAEEHNEPQFAKGVGGLSYADNEPVDVVAGRGGRVEHGIELKTMVSNKASKLTMDRYAQVRKVAWEGKNDATFHTCVIDDREVYNAKGAAKHDESKRVYYYRRGVAGSARIESMQKCKSIGEVKKLMATPEANLPPGAQRTDGKLHEGKWKEINDKQGRCFKNSKTGEIVRPKK